MTNKKPEVKTIVIDLSKMVSKKRHYLIKRSCELAEDQTPIEKAVEDVLHSMELYGYSQIPIGESYIVDFQCSDGKTLIECDGAQYHSERNEKRDRVLIEQGYRVLHLSGRTCLNKALCSRKIQEFIDDDADLRYA